MTSSSILPTLACTNSTLMDFLPVQTNVSSMSLPVNTLDICYHRRPHHGPVQSPDHPRLANTMKSQGYSIFPQLCQLLLSFHLQIFQNHISTYASYPQGYPLAFLQ